MESTDKYGRKSVKREMQISGEVDVTQIPSAKASPRKADPRE